MNKFRVKRTSEVTKIVEEYGYIYGDTFELAFKKHIDSGYFHADSITNKDSSYKYGDIILVEDEYEGMSEEYRNFSIMTDEIHKMINNCISDEELDSIEYDNVDDYIKLKVFETYGKEIEVCQDNNCCLWGYKDEMIDLGNGHYHKYCIERCISCGNDFNKSELNEDGLCWRCEY